jgi:hypothetical protein
VCLFGLLHAYVSSAFISTCFLHFLLFFLFLECTGDFFFCFLVVTRAVLKGKEERKGVGGTWLYASSVAVDPEGGEESSQQFFLCSRGSPSPLPPEPSLSPRRLRRGVSPPEALFSFEGLRHGSDACCTTSLFLSA